MTYRSPCLTTLTSKAYAALRQGGAPPLHAGAQLALPPCVATRLEQTFLVRHNRTPRFARHAAHVAAVLEAGGYPALAR